MNDLPPDPPRLRAILAHLEQQLATNETIATYLRLQREAAQKALAEAEHQSRPRPPAAASKRRTAAPDPDADAGTPPGTGFVVEPRDKNDATKGAVIHTAACSWAPRDARSVEAGLVRVSLTKDTPFFEACRFCRPDNAMEYYT